MVVQLYVNLFPWRGGSAGEPSFAQSLMSSSSLLLFLDLSRFFHQADRASLLPFRAFSASVSSTSLSTYPTRSLLSIHPVLSVSRSTVRSLSEKGGGDGGGAVVRSQQENTEGELAEAEKEFVADGVGISGTSESEPSFQQQEKRRRMVASADSISLGIREPVYEVIEVKSDGTVSTRKINRRQLLKSSGLRPRDVRSVDPSLWLMNSMPSLLVREQAILMNLGSLRAIVMNERVLIFDYNRKGGRAFLKTLLPRLNSKSNSGGLAMPFELEVVEAALLSRINRLEHRIMDIEPRVELGSRAGELKQMLLDLLEDPHEIRRICIMGRNCTIRRGSNDVECSLLLDKQIAEEEEEEIEMLLENYLQRCESCHGQAERLLDSAKEMEDSIAVNLSSRRLEVSRVELLLQVGTFCVAVGALVAGIFGMNLRSYLEEHAWAFWLTTTGIIFGAVAAFFLLYSYLKSRRIL
ncbi:magnesium transporter MRS2-11, chloroplastic-like isoform X2 [Zingiber officinale]|uniref:magnesium transporter MRS2-11, chloroplastic-like isoform X2 n=1 Tax=Zingiber officinale TaxID=94328 RepID=UPI001C4C7AF0|nr:magnesium transporter MRS2-11, chloroplastic-like isoform X2 [Zingiber officinale]